MGKTFEIFPEPTVATDDGWRRRCQIVSWVDGTKSEKQLWWEYPSAAPQPSLTDCNSYLIATLLPAMKQGADIQVRGSVSRELLANLAELQCAWAKLCPDIYKEVSIEVDMIRDDNEPTAGAVVAFSGGADAQFTAYRHAKGLAGHAKRPVSAGVFVQGFDIPLEDHTGFFSAAERAKLTLTDIGLDLILVRTNIRDVSSVNWEHYFAAAIASVLSGLEGFAGIGLIASSEPYDSLVTPWGSHPMTDPLLSSKRFRILHDGAGYSRSEKISTLAGWEAGVRNLRVCWAGGFHDRNCGRCEKCIRTRLNFLLAGVPQPSCFDAPLQGDHLASLVLSNNAVRGEWRLIRDEMLRTGIGADLLPNVERVLKRPAIRWGRILPVGSRTRDMAKRIMGKA